MSRAGWSANLGTVGQDKAHAREDVDNLVGNDRQRMACTHLNGVGRARQVDGLVASLLCGAVLAQFVDALCGQRLQFVDLHANGLLLVGGHVAEIVHKGCDFTLLAKVFQAQLFYFLSVLRAQCLYFFQKFVNLVKYHFNLQFDKLLYTGYLILRAKVLNNYEL